MPTTTSGVRRASRTIRGWPGTSWRPIRRPFGPRELRPLLQAEGVDRTVLVQTRSSLDETREFLAIADAEPFVAGVVGWVDLTDPGVADVIAGLRAGPGGERLARDPPSGPRRARCRMAAAAGRASAACERWRRPDSPYDLAGAPARAPRRPRDRDGVPGTAPGRRPHRPSRRSRAGSTGAVGRA